VKVATKFGFDLTLRDGSYMATEFAANQCYEEPESRLVLSLIRPGDFCIDAGAHIGYYSCLMAKAGARVLAVECNPMHFVMLSQNIRDFSVIESHMALGELNTDGPVDFNLPTEWDDGCGTLYPVRNNAKQVGVWMMRLDSLLDVGASTGERVSRIRLLKLDIEGSELAALRGLGARLADVDYILMECGEYYAAKTISQINEHMQGWTIRAFSNGEWRDVQKATTGNFLFMNPKANE
jgi:FkbM family methyltransferase